MNGMYEQSRITQVYVYFYCLHVTEAWKNI